MTEEEFKKVMTKTICFIVIALVLLIIIGIFVFNQSGKTTSIFSSQQEVDAYKKKVEEVKLSKEAEVNNETVSEVENTEANVTNEITTDGTEAGVQPEQSREGAPQGETPVEPQPEEVPAQ